MSIGEGNANRRTRAFKEKLERLPVEIQTLAEQAFELFLRDPAHPSLRNHELAATAKGRHKKGSRSVSITMKYRAIYLVDEQTSTNVWYWIGSHTDYDTFIGKK